jgi:hypothetical protein
MSPPLAKARFSVDFFERNFNPCQGDERASIDPARHSASLARSVKVTPEAELLTPSPREKECHHVHPINEHSTSVAAVVAAGIVLFGLLSPAMAASDQNSPTVMR